MKSIIIGLMMVLTAGIASADPRMEINDNFCHMILDATNTDNEIFVAGCNAQIVADGNGGATGYVMITRWMPREEAQAMLGEDDQQLSFTSDGSDAPCRMVESNGTTYESNDWESRIIFKRPWKEINKVVYYLYCRDGVAQ